MNTMNQLELFAGAGDEIRLRARDVSHRDMSPVSQAIRYDIRRHRKLGLPVYHPIRTRQAVRSQLADGDWHCWLDLCRELNVGAYGLSETMDRMERMGEIEKRPRYYGADPLTPNEKPENYRGFQFEYRNFQN